MINKYYFTDSSLLIDYRKIGITQINPVNPGVENKINTSINKLIINIKIILLLADIDRNDLLISDNLAYE